MSLSESLDARGPLPLGRAAPRCVAGASSPSVRRSAGDAASAQEVAASLQKKYDTIRDFSADFVHTHEGGVLKRKREERGTLVVKKPGKMRWDYKAPDEKVFVSDGVRLIQYLPEENHVIVSAVPEDDQAAVLFLAGRGNLTRDFTVTFGEGGAAGVVDAPARAKATAAGVRLARDHGGARDAPAPVADRRREAGQPVDLPVHELQGKPRTGR